MVLVSPHTPKNQLTSVLDLEEEQAVVWLKVINENHTHVIL